MKELASGGMDVTDADTASRFALPPITTETTACIQSDWLHVNLRFHLPGDWSAALHSLRIDNSLSDLAPARVSVPVLAPARPSVPVSAPARLSVSVLAQTGISVLVLAPAVVDSLPVTIPQRPESSEAIFSALGSPQDKPTIAIDLQNRAICLIMALEASTNIIFVSTYSPRQFIVRAFTGDIPILTTVPIIPECGLILWLNHHPEHGIFSSPGAAFWVEEYDPYHSRTPLTSTVLPFDPVPYPIPLYITVYAKIPWPQADEVGFFNVIH